MYFQRAGVAGSPVIHLIPTSSLSIELNSPYLLGSIGCSFGAPVTKRSGYDSFQPLQEAVFVRML
ncbi:hypothetical protein [Neobacillus niacini]|uniref:hypothetical protein n=1 Tax=Neobacillus niacini TaxID=86668 RepID=UPI0005EE75BE|nr:hypothetical protein [Neobacillus niacini]